MKHLLPCPCGKQIAVSTSQAGETVTCECGMSVEAPSLRGLRDLPLVEAEDSRRGTWGFRQGVLTAGLIAVLGLVGAVGWLRAIEPEPPSPFDAAAREEIVGRGLDSMGPADAWRLWETAYKPLTQRGLEVFESPGEAQLNRQIAFSQTVQSRLLTGAGVLLALTLALFAALPK